ncbi:GDSL-type esterase/lipase family protein [Coraliomargarita sp. SDUM461004]|uniref:GDSL-type esterase/lipase family protein n=1 Tax=Thalassobacterium sedimentorum TaxID=3041258 RepID=A0ABU1AIQ0_9BACT|nr:GDSL-type esterase/lipase family protein [Coraliomargarita sp. SDUM461004]MDQ8194572.1 GDSL-type esterase/lipase family protein [Coraliomargarita sp. SDUM461004]
MFSRNCHPTSQSSLFQLLTPQTWHTCQTWIYTLLVVALLQPQMSLAADYPQRSSTEFTARGGLPNFFKKLDAGEDLTIAYLGGSITAQAGWRVLSQQWLEKEYPKANIKGIHAAIGGTGSDLGVFRVENDALAHKPDLLFIEFAVNDANAEPTKIIQAMEGIVRKTWQSNPQTDICFVYTMTFRDSTTLADGAMKRSASVMEEIADHYDIPSVHMGYQAALLEKAGKLIMKTDAPMTRVSGDELNEAAELATDEEGRIIFSKDGVHPYVETGHILYTDALIRSLKKIQKTTGKVQHKLMTPMRADNLENAQQIPLISEYLSGDYTDMRREGSKRFQKEMKQLYRLAPGATLSFKFKGTEVAIYDWLGYDSSQIEITLDGQTSIRTRMDGYCTYQRLARLSVGNNLEDRIHTVSIRVLDTELDKRDILFERNRADYDKNPAKYTPHYWYAGAIFIVGELVE